MVDQIYDLFAKFGYIHPVHPPLTHGPIGAVIVAFMLCLGLWFWPRKNLLQAAYYAVLVGFILYFPTVVAGVLDWQHFFFGALIFPIKMKITLAALLFVLLTATLIVGRKPHAPQRLMCTLFTLCLLNVLGLGYFGGILVYEGRVPEAGEGFAGGRKIFINRCSGCHANGGNILYPNLPLRLAPQLESYEHFLAFLRNPKLPNGENGPMPAFKPNKLSDPQVKELYDYVIHGFAKPTRDE
ncbi:MAG: c-type cytochrome [Gammaproteobacteria bacterium]